MGKETTSIQVKSTVIDWQKQTMEITSTTGEKRSIPLTTVITVAMVGYPDRVEKTFDAAYLGQFMSQGYIIEQISFEEEK